MDRRTLTESSMQIITCIPEVVSQSDKRAVPLFIGVCLLNVYYLLVFMWSYQEREQDLSIGECCHLEHACNP